MFTSARARVFGKKILIYIGAAIVIIVALEAGLQVLHVLIPERADTRFTEFSVYRNKPWAKDIFQDQIKFDLLPVRFDRYSIWLLPSLESTYLNIDEEGRRKTWNPEFAPDAAPKEVWFMGGSAVISAGARDEYTIPSLFSKIMDARKGGDVYRVVNYGRPAFVFSQSIAELAKFLKLGRKPAYVIFYNGGSEVNAAYDTGYGEALAAEANWRNIIEANSFTKMKTGALELIRDYCRTCRVVINIARSFNSGALRMNPIKGKTYDDAKIAALAPEVVKTYAANLDLVDRLSRSYGFRYAVVWQPSPFGDRFVGDEQKLVPKDWRLKDTNLAKLYMKTLALLNAQSLPHFFDFSKALKDRSEQMFFDSVHVSEEGNQAVAEKIAELFPSGM